MGWFVLAAILGFAAPKAWRTLGPAGRRRMAIAGVTILGAAIITIGPWLLFRASSNPASLSVGWINDPAFTRVVLGLILGAGADYVSRERQPPAGQASDQPSPAGDQKPPAAVSLSLAAGIVALAAVAPHLDDWLAHLSGFKTSLIEIQLTNLSSTSKAIEPIQRQGFNRDVVLQTLVNYDELIENDIQFIKQFEFEDIEDQKNRGYDPKLEEKKKKREGQLEQLERLQRYFKRTVSPAARCFKAAIDGGLSIPAARSRLRDLAGDLTQLIKLEAEEKRKPGTSKSGAIVGSHQKLINGLGKATDEIVDFVDPANQADCHPKIDVASALLSTEYEDIPHLDVARALLLIFVDQDNLRRKVLREAASKEFKDFTTPRLLAALMFFRGDSMTQYYDMLEEIRKLARERLEIIKRVNEKKCSLCDREYWAKKLTKWAQRAEEIALNNIAYGIAVDVTERRIGAVDMLPIAENCVEALKKADDTAEDDSALDTIAFVTIVAEAQRAKTTSIDKAKISEAINLLRRAAARDEEALSSESAKGEDVDYSGLKSIQAHLASARGLLE